MSTNIRRVPVMTATVVETFECETLTFDGKDWIWHPPGKVETTMLPFSITQAGSPFECEQLLMQIIRSGPNARQATIYERMPWKTVELEGRLPAFETFGRFGFLVCL